MNENRIENPTGKMNNISGVPIFTPNCIMKNECYSKGQLNARAEALLMGFVIYQEDIDNIKYVIDYVSNVLKNNVKADEIIKLTYKYITEKEKIKIVGLSLNTFMNEMIVLTLILKDDDDVFFNIENKDGVFCYAYNYTYPDCSELGYSYFRNDNGKLHRIG